MDKDAVLLEKWRLASELARHEDNLSWQKFGYGVAINGALLGVLTVSNGPKPGASLLAILLPLFGALVSFAWHVMQVRGARYQALRICQAKEVEAELNVSGQLTLSLYRTGLPKPRFRLSVYGIGTQRIMAAVSLLFTLGWLLVLVDNLGWL